MPRPRMQRGTLPIAGILLLPILVAYAIMARYALDVPQIDDYPTILGFAVRYQALPTAGARLHYILADQYTEYKLAFIHVFTAAQLALTHHVSFAFTFWMGQLSLLGILPLLWKSFFRDVPDLRRRLLLFAPIVFVLFTLNYGEALDWVAPAVGYLLTILLSLTALYLLCEGAESDRRAWPAISAGLAALSALTACSIAANAFLLGPLGLFALWPRGARWTPQRVLRAGLWCAAFALALVPYFVHYGKDLHAGTGSALLIPVFFVEFVGAGTPLGHTALPLGLLILGVYGVAVRRGFYRTHPAATLGVTWLLISAALAALGRGRTGLAFATVSRYKIYSDLFLIFCYGYLAERFLARPGALAGRTQRRVLAATIALAVLFCLRGDHQGYGILRNRHAQLQAAFARYETAPEKNSPLWFNDGNADTFFKDYAVRAREATNAAAAADLYHPPR